MNLGERLFTLRTQKNLSQGDLAEKLDVSRQSVSKWENNSAVPDLEKIIKLSEVFGVTVDFLVKGTQSEESAETQKTQNAQAVPAQTVVQVVQKEHLQPRVLAGIILLSVGFLAAVLLLVLTGWGFVYALPILLCGCVCLLAKKEVGLYCAWVVYLLAAAYFSWGSAANWRYVFQTFQWTSERNYVILIISWVWFVLMVALVVVSILRFAKRPVTNMKKTVAIIVCSTAFIIVNFIIGQIINARIIQLLEAGQSMVTMSSGVQLFFSVFNQIELIAFTAVFAQICKLLYNRLKKRKE